MALSTYGSPGDVFGSSPQTATFGSAVSLGDLMLAKVQIGTGTAPTVSDSVSSGANWTLVPGTGAADGTTPYWFYWFSKVMNVTSATAPVVTVTGGAFIDTFNVIAVTGFSGTPSFDATNTNLQTGTTVGAGTANTVQSTTQSGEILLAMWAGTSSFFIGAPSPSWSNWPSSSWQSVLIGPEPSGTNCNGSFTPNAATFWVQSLIGVYDAIAPSSYSLTSSMEF
jgi:hypothetical protein